MTADRAITIDSSVAAALHDGICRAIDQGLTIAYPAEAFGSKCYWTIDSSDGSTDYLVMVERHDNGAVTGWCDCLSGQYGRVCKHLSIVLDAMGLIPTTTEGTTDA